MRFLVRRLGFLVVALWAAMTVNFFIPRLMPGNPALAMMAKFRGHVNPNALHALEVAFGVHTHANVFTQYFQYLGDTLTGHLGSVYSAAFSPDGKRVVTAGQDGTARVYIVDLVDLVTWAEHQLPIETQ